MKIDSLFERYRKRLKRIGIVKALLCAMIFGFAINFLIAFITLFLYLNIIEILIFSIGFNLITVAILAPIFYIKLFRPTTKKIAHIVDKLGLEERLITMYELENDESYIAMRQREDAKEKLSDVKESEIKLRLPKIAIVLLTLMFVLSTSMTTVTSLDAIGYFESNDGSNKEEDNIDDEKEYFNVTYLFGDGGFVEGETIQRIEKGKDATAVTARPYEGYYFLRWSDGLTTINRWDLNIKEDITVEAIFKEVEDEKENNDSNDEDDKKENDPGTGDGMDENDDENDDENGKDKEEDGSDGENGGKGDNEDGDEKDDNSSNGAGAGGSLDNNKVIDGNTDYRDAFDHDQSKDEVENDNTIPDDLKDILGDYFDSLKQ